MLAAEGTNRPKPEGAGGAGVGAGGAGGMAGLPEILALMASLFL